jgi:sialate O-acetylesterase
MDINRTLKMLLRNCLFRFFCKTRRSFSAGMVGLLGLLPPAGVDAVVSLHQLFTDNVVLQQNAEVNIWGNAFPDEAIEVSGSWSETVVQTVAAEDGTWIVKLPTPAAPTDGTTYTLTVTGNNTVTLENVAIGDVWIVAGQSNVNITMSFNIEGATEAVASANHPGIRLLRLGDRPTAEPQDNFRQHGSYRNWRVCTPQTVEDFSAVGYFFARDFHQKTGVPVAMIHSAKAGSLARSWTPREELEAISEFSGQGPWELADNSADNPYVPTIYYNGNIAPLRRFTIRGVLWYQGESNVDIDDPEIYAQTLPALIQGWRRVWGQGDFPFFLVQIVPWPGYPNDSYPEVIEVQNSVLSLPNTGLAVTVDLADERLHPPHKREIGERLSFLARSRLYEDPVTESGPLYAGKLPEGNSLRVYFAHTGDGLILEEPHGFEIASDDLVFHPAEAKVENRTVILKSPEVDQPAHVRYAWNTYPTAALFNTAGLPAPPFRSDIPGYVRSIFDHVPREWAGHAVVKDGYIRLPGALDWTHIDKAPWLYVAKLGKWIYLPEGRVRMSGGWIYVTE